MTGKPVCMLPVVVCLALGSVGPAWAMSPVRIAWLPDRYEVSLEASARVLDSDSHSLVAWDHHTGGANPAYPGTHYRVHAEVPETQVDLHAYEENIRGHFDCDGLAGTFLDYDPHQVAGCHGTLQLHASFLALDSGPFDMGYRLRAEGSRGGTNFLTQLTGPDGVLDSFHLTTYTWTDYDQVVSLSGPLQLGETYDLSLYVDLDAWDRNFNGFSLTDFRYSAVPVPEPTALALFGLGCLVLASLRAGRVRRG